MPSKAEIRQQTMQQLTAMSVPDRRRASDELYQQLWALPAYQQAKTIATTISGGFELATRPIIERAQADGKIVAVPQTLPHRQMAFHVMDETTTLARTKFGLMEPQDNQIVDPAAFDLLVVPGLVFASTGERLGFGGGYYDRYLPKTTGVKVALALPAQQTAQPTWPVDPFDILLDAVLAANLE
ncbi:5-formyltetrahydrofolate cyclo-ligase [Levilactobacillus tujiorum]|uniref:5-formyltetrahydrofolate cyclo-ligase n=1 Tax=Levilactobacillus tujiorum TaxID=2912243 RepID=A0ABX1L4F0_9LACO|nr:5-formyltetrahydrofolate cyclo-ligase [Levilactobacillus tujiorum]MCH5464573.1 5-formyltetrahydrofolate cyclo-ligase [Levilactobacillus tujiorum]NLR11729.1 5-formyltetrahydrofolate cyclo-ligase [Lactobacillus sp. HBUAS51387]NLR29553.1 5-formyltetrahydrofolate cyclo-ligase [Levilactobacillus tujiorum]